MKEKEEKVEETTTDNTELLEVVKNEYENKIAQIKKDHQEEIKKIKEEMEDRHIKEIRAIISGRQESFDTAKNEEVDKGFFETTVEETLKNFKI